MDFLDELKRFASHLAKESGDMLMEGLTNHSKRTYEWKGDNNFVTDMDRKVDDFIIGAIKKEYPDHLILTEESGHVKTREGSQEGKFQWIIDPLDGTTSYAHGHPCFSVSIGIVQIGTGPVVGVVYAPVFRELYSAVLGQGAFLNGERITVSSVPTLKQSLISTGFPYDAATEVDNNFDAFRAVAVLCQGQRRNGSAAIDLCFIAKGAQDAYWEVVLCPWDYCAGLLIVREAGGMVTDIDTGDLPPMNRMAAVLATNGLVHEEILQVIRANRKPRVQGSVN